METPGGPIKGPWGPNKGASKGQKWLKLSKIFNFFLFGSHPIHSGNRFSLFLYSSYAGGVVENNKRVWGPTRGFPKVPKWPQDGSPKDQYRPFLNLWDPLVGPPGVLMLVYHFLLLPPLKISVKIMKTCCLSELDGTQINSRISVTWSEVPFAPSADLV